MAQKRRRMDDEERFYRPTTPPRPTASDAAAAAPARIRGTHRRNIVMVPTQEDYRDEEDAGSLQRYSRREPAELERQPAVDPFLATLPSRGHTDTDGGGSNSARLLAYQEECKRQKLLESCYGSQYPTFSSSSSAAAAAKSSMREEEGGSDVFGPRKSIASGSAPPSAAPHANQSRVHAPLRPPPQPLARTIYSRNMPPEGFGQQQQHQQYWQQQDDAGENGVFMGQASQEDVRHQNRLNIAASLAAADARRNGLS